MLDVCLLGTGGMMPLPRRALTALMLRVNGSNILIDCGEATQVAVRKKGWSFKAIDLICITHFHGDHVGGLPGLWLTMANSDRTEPLTMIGPKGIAEVCAHLRVIAPELPFDINYIEIESPEQEFEFKDFKITSFKLKHRITCFGYSLTMDRAGRFDTDRANALGLPVKLWGRLQKGETVKWEGKPVTPDMVLGPKRRGLKVTYCTDTRPVDNIVKYAKDADLFICEGMYGDPEKAQDAVKKKHMTFYEAAEIGKQAEPRRMWLTHYSPSLVYPAQYMDAVHEIFDKVEPGKDLKSITLNYDEE